MFWFVMGFIAGVAATVVVQLIFKFVVSGIRDINID